MSHTLPCLILARGGSKGIPKKNIIELCGRPLLKWVIDSAKESNEIGNIFVSTDCKIIADVAKSCGVEVIMRPNELAQDNSLDIDAFKPVLNFIGSESIVHLRATTPTIDPSVLDTGILFFKKNLDYCTSMRSGQELPESLLKYYFLEDGYFKTIVESGAHTLNRQSLSKTFVPNGYIDIVKSENIINFGSMYGDRILAFITEPVIEIDSIEEYEYLKYKLEIKNGKSS